MCILEHVSMESHLSAEQGVAEGERWSQEEKVKHCTLPFVPNFIIFKTAVTV